MSAPLSLVRLRPDLPALARWGIGRGYLSRHGDADFGYVLHVALRDGLGRLAPRPFVLRASRGANEPGELLGYVRATPETMKEATALPPVNGSANALDLAAMEVRAMPEHWRAGACFSFEVRVRPIVRTRRGGRATPEKRAEVDEFDAAAWAALRVRDDTGTVPSREEVYRGWLAARMEFRGAHLIGARIIAMRRTRVRRRPHVGGERRTRDVEGPDVLFRGELSVSDGERFAEGMVRGVGRHTAFGFGCLLLAPPGAWG